MQKVKNTIILLMFLGLFRIGLVNGQNDWEKTKIHIVPTVCYASDHTEKSFIPPPMEFNIKSGKKKSDFIVTYSLFPTDGKAKAAFEYAVSIWEQIIESDIPIHIDANWRTMENNTLPRVFVSIGEQWKTILFEVQDPPIILPILNMPQIKNDFIPFLLSKKLPKPKLMVLHRQT